VWIDQDMAHSSLGPGTVEIDLCDLGIVVLSHDGHVASTNERARELLRAESQSALDARLNVLQEGLGETPRLHGSLDEMPVDVPGLGTLGVRSCAVGGFNGDGRVLLLRDVRSLPSTENLLQQAARHRSFTFLARDWAHDLKGMLHVIRINSALLGRLLQRESDTMDAAVTKCLDAIPREVERLDHAIELMLSARPDEQQSTFDLGAMCERLKNLIAARAIRQRVEVVLELKPGPKEIVGFEEQVKGALLNVLVNALEAMPEQGRLVISAEGNAKDVTIHIGDSGAGMPPQPNGRHWRPQFVNDRRQTGIGLHVTRAVVETHGGRIECASNVPHGTCIEITFPTAASTGIGHGSRTHR
jgi:signal transduction histidine kinase